MLCVFVFPSPSDYRLPTTDYCIIRLMKLDGRAVAGLYIAGALGLTLLQLVLFAPVVGAGRALDAGPFRVDGLSLVAGVVWTLCLGLAMSRSRPGAVPQGLLAGGLFAVCY